MRTYERIILGAGLYGLYAALFCAKRGERVLVLEHDASPFSRATYVNQARVHMGYHYPRSISTALKSHRYFDRFVEDFGFCIEQAFDQVYATSGCFSWTNAAQFQSFCKNAGIPCEEIPAARYFQPDACDGAFLTKEFTYDALLLKEHLLGEITGYPEIELVCSARNIEIAAEDEAYLIRVDGGEPAAAEFVLNATYASVNQVLGQMDFQPFKIKYELCEIILCEVDERLKRVGLTVMDGPFFSIMPFGKSGLHSLTAVTFTPHVASHSALPSFACQSHPHANCTPARLGNCNECPARPASAWPYMSSLARKYLRSDYGFRYVKSLYSMKPILLKSEIDDSRPTVIRCSSENPTFISVLSGKINTVYDLDEVLTK
jgi:glycine/D-amino acid oxidase-like deaminating enzyme